MSKNEKQLLSNPKVKTALAVLDVFYEAHLKEIKPSDNEALEFEFTVDHNGLPVSYRILMEEL